MARLTVRGIPDELAAALKARAARAGRSAEAEHRCILEEALRPQQASDFFAAARAPHQARSRRRRHHGPPAQRPRPGRRVSAARTREAPLVMDASVALKWLVEEPGSEAALALQGRDLAAPALLRLEAANVLRTLVARGVADRAQALDLLALLQTVPVTIVEPDDAL